MVQFRASDALNALNMICFSQGGILGLITRMMSSARIILFACVFYGWWSPAMAQDLVRQCTDISEQGEGMAVEADEVGTIHIAHAARVSGTLRYTTVAPDGSTSNEVIANRIHRFPTSDTLGVGLALFGGDVFVCYHNQSTREFRLATQVDGIWSTELIEGNATGDGCVISIDNGQIDLFYEDEGRLRWAYQRNGGAWNKQTVDGSAGRVGVLPSVTRLPNGALVVAYGDADGRRLKVAVRVGNAWSIDTPILPIDAGGHNPQVALVGDEVHIFHASTTGVLDVESDDTLIRTVRRANGVYESALFPDFSVGGHIGAAAGDQGVFVGTRHLSRNALFGDSDGLLLFSGVPLESTTLESYGLAQGRHVFRFVRVALDPFGWPIIVFVDAFAGGVGQPAGASLCLWRPRDSDGDRIPDVQEDAIGTNPSAADTDGDGVSDGNEVLVDGTDPLADDVCRPVREVCNGQDDDCDGRTDENIERACYGGPPGSQGQGICRGGQQACNDGVWQSCVGEVIPDQELCNSVDDDCDGTVDEAIPGEGEACDTGLAGRCSSGSIRCFAGALRCQTSNSPIAETCNGLDDDCDSVVDEGTVSCGSGVCQRTVIACLAGVDNRCTPLAPTGDDDTCDGEDNDCDGSVDESAPRPNIQCGFGACLAAGQSVCVNGVYIDQCVPGESAAVDECDGVDNDCDGLLDEDFSPRQVSCGQGLCQANGQAQCIDGQVQSDCTPLDVSRPDSLCDGQDQDCDGRVDEAFVGRVVTCGSGACQGEGVRRCVDGVVIDQCEVGQGNPDVDCDGIDDDCDSRIDEGYQPEGITCGVGACVANGQRLCQAGGALEDVCLPFDPSNDDTCDGVDDDCDGRLDEAAPLVPVSCGTGVCRRDGRRACDDGAWAIDCQVGPPLSADQDCNGNDDDCDGQVDEAFASGNRVCGLGVCRSEGMDLCIDGEIQSQCEPLAPLGADNQCDGLDQDCDGRVDEGYRPSAVQCGTGACQRDGQTACVNGQEQTQCIPGGPSPDTNCDGLDDDCDRRFDEAYVGRARECGVGACQTEAIDICQEGEVRNGCEPFDGEGVDSDCDGEDTDCDGRIDEGFEAGNITCGQGVCARDGRAQCQDGVIRPSCQPGPPSGDDRNCDGLDDDCDGRIDEGFVGAAVQCGVGACVNDGVTVCRLGQVVNSCVPAQGADRDSRCDGIDEDCDGRTDEDFTVTAIECGRGACVRVGARQCVNGRLVDRCDPGLPALDDGQCDGVDADCDGVFDEDFTSRAIQCGRGICQRNGNTICIGGAEEERCRPGRPSGQDAICDGVDQDCDGRSDEAYAPSDVTCGQGVCLAEGVTACVGGAVQEQCAPSQPRGATDTCDGIDDDCDGRIDEDHVLEDVECGVGSCARRGVLACSDGRLVEQCSPAPPVDGDTACDGRDSDCDGRMDEGYRPTATTCGQGVCASGGELACVGGQLRDTCREGDPILGADTCDGVDSDCDGANDEDHQVVRSRCSTGVCASSGRIRCIDGEQVDTCTPRPVWGRDSTCDGIDADCDGRYDERFAPAETACGVGACLSEGTTRCTGGQVIDSCMPNDPVGDDRNCDGIDDDCDGSVDEDFASTIVRCGVGFCASVGQTRCQDGQIIETCEPGQPRGSDSVCDGIDADCDGVADERYRATRTECGVGACRGNGILSCRDGQVVNTCRAGSPAGVDAQCDGIDSDCDGSVDEGYAVSPVRCGVGACARTGTRRCDDGRVVTECTPGRPTGDDIICDGLDSDCDGQTDEAVRRSESTCGRGICRTRGETLCVAGELVDNCRPLEPNPDDASCDEQDSDCDGRVDEDYRPNRISCGTGVCASDGITQCFAGRERFNCREGLPEGDDENCDGLDDDCDGQVDEGFRPQVVECGVGMCANRINTRCIDGRVDAQCRPEEPMGADDQCDGLDTDCDGRIDEEVERETECGVGACRSTGTNRCVGTDEVDDCVPGTPSPDDQSCDGIDDDCDLTIDEDCPVDMGIPVSDAFISNDMMPARDMEISTDTDEGVEPFDAFVPEDGLAPVNDSGSDLGNDGVRPADFGYIDSGTRDDPMCDGTNCDDLGGSERSRPVKEGCDCEVGSGSGPNPVWLWAIIGLLIRRKWLRKVVR